MLIAGRTTLRNQYGCAKRLRHNDEVAPDMITMAVVVCDQCGARFGIGHRVDACDANLATRQLAWLRDQFVWDHIRETKHHGSIALPSGESCAPENTPVVAELR